jgi:transcriptional regulator with XRE-family HTH domain
MQGSEGYVGDQVVPIHLAIRSARKHAGLSQRQLALRIGCPRTWISKIEIGMSVPTITSLLRIAKAIGIEAWRLLRCAEHWDRKIVEVPAPPEVK